MLPLDDNNTVRIRRTKDVSVDQVEGETPTESELRADRLDKPCHIQRESLWSSSSGFYNYRGFVNVWIVLLVLSSASLILENIMKYGILIDPIQLIELFLYNPSRLHYVLIMLGLGFISCISLGIEKFLSKDKISENVGLFFVIVILSAVLLFPLFSIVLTDCHAVAAGLIMLHVVVLFPKLISYHMVNYWCRSGPVQPRDKQRRSISSETKNKYKDASEVNNGVIKTETVSYPDNLNLIDASEVNNGVIKTEPVSYPDNLNLIDLCYFLIAPTLCYELNFPRTTRIRKMFLFKRVLETILLFPLILFLIQQWIVPIVYTLKPLEEMDYLTIFERLLKLAIPTHFIWLISFYWFFHSFLNALAEFLRFGDRYFYNDWWNAESVEYFWKNWNIPVHKSCLRHIYRPCRNYGLPKSMSIVIVFLLTAFSHEYFFSTPLKMFNVWSFVGMMSQLPFTWFVDKHLRNQYANMAVWASLIIGQPLCFMLYYNAYLMKNFRETEASV